MEIIAFVDSTNTPICPICRELIQSHRVKADKTVRMKNFFKYKGVNYQVHPDCKNSITQKTIKAFRNSIKDMISHPTYHKRIVHCEDSFHSKKWKEP